jgi:vitamin B12 transporter
MLFQENIMSLVYLIAALAPAPVVAEQVIIVTASREPVAQDEAAASVTLFETEIIEALSLPLASDLLRLAPGVSVSVAGSRGSQAQLRIRGAEASHSLLFVDGIRFNDPAAGNEARFELLTTDALARIEVVRGPQSALWGSEALGGVIAAQTADPFAVSGFSALAEYGGHDSSRVAASGALRFGDVGLSASAGQVRSDGIDALGAGGERDGFELRFASAKAVYRPIDAFELGVSAHGIEGDSAYDSYDPAIFRRGNTLHATANQLSAIRGWATGREGGWTLTIDSSLLDSANRNRIGEDPINRTYGRRVTFGGQVSKAIGGHMITAAVEHEGEDFQGRDNAYFGGTDQDRSRSLTAFVAQWRADWHRLVSTDLAVRHDDFSAFEDATTLRAAVLVRPTANVTLHAAYGEGIAQPSFYDLYGFFPRSFVGNPALRPEHSRGFEVGLRWQGPRLSLSAVAFSNRLRDEILTVFNPVTWIATGANATGESRRRGIELEARYAPVAGVTVGANYTLLDAEEQTVAGSALVREVRRPRHSANLFATGTHGRLNWGGALSYVGKRSDMDFEVFPARTVTLDDYLLASLRVGYEFVHGIELYGRVENGFDADYRDVVGYATPGRTFHAGVRVAFGR